MGEAHKDAVGSDTQIEFAFLWAASASYAGLVAYRELDGALGLTAMADDILRDPWRGKSTQRELEALPRQSPYSRLAGCEDTNDAERRPADPAMRQAIDHRARYRQAASTSQMGRFETKTPTRRKNLYILMGLPGTGKRGPEATLAWMRRTVSAHKTGSNSKVRQAQRRGSDGTMTEHRPAA